MDKQLLVGWREWAKLPLLNVPWIKIKIDTGANTSALHVYDLKTTNEDGKLLAHFIVHPLQANDIVEIKCTAEVIDTTTVKSSNGQKELRYVIRTPITIGVHTWHINITLTNRDIMRHRMLLGREAMRFLLVSPSKAYCQGKVSKKMLGTVYQ